MVALLLANTASADARSDVEFILQAEKPPIGVVFEIVEGREDALAWAIPLVKGYIERLRARFPDMSFAVVSHGREEFGLLKENRQSQAKVHRAVQSLVQDDKVPVEVCGTHAGWYHKARQDFPDYVTVVDEAPASIADYQRSGYALVEIDRPTRKP